MAAPPRPVHPGDSADFYLRKRRLLPNGVEETERSRHGDQLTIKTSTLIRRNEDGDRFEETSTRTRVIDASVPMYKIRNACVVTPDDDNCEAPWEHCDGYEHTLIPLDTWLDKTVDNESLEDRWWRHATNWLRPSSFVASRHGGYFLQLEHNRDLYAWCRARGASRQVAAEQVAIDRRRTLQQLREWYCGGFCPHTAECNLEIGGVGYTESCGSFWSEPEAQEWVDDELIPTIVQQLEEDGFRVPGYTRPDWKVRRRESAVHQYKRNVHLFDWDAA